MPHTHTIQRQYEGYLQTPVLWRGSNVFDMQQLKLPNQSISTFTRPLPKGLRLGKRVEQFVFNELQNDSEMKLLAENIQIQQGTRTIGELDLLFMQGELPVHLEIIYKFYIYDASVGTTALEHWIGPNRKDSLIEKLHKLRDKQLPLLYRPETKPLIERLHLDIDQIQQKVCFKAQLFLPLQSSPDIKDINKDCLAGFYLHTADIHLFKPCKFYIPQKADWLVNAHQQVPWMNYEACKDILEQAQINSISECCWIKHPNGMIDKCFVVWW